MNEYLVCSALAVLKKHEDDPMLKDQVLSLQLELEFLKLFSKCFSAWRNAQMETSLSNIGAELLRTEDNFCCFFIRGRQGRSKVGLAVRESLEMAELCKPEMKSKCFASLDRSYSIVRAWHPREAVPFLDSILKNLRYVLDFKTNMNFRAKKQVRCLEEKVNFFRNLADFMVNECLLVKELQNNLIHIQAWAKAVACLAILYWIDDFDEKTPNAIEVYFRVPKGSNSAGSSHTPRIGVLVTSFVGYFLQNMGIPGCDFIEALREGMIFLATFLLDRPEEHAENGELILTATDDSVSEATSLICSLYVQKMEGKVFKEMDTLLFDFLDKVDTLKTEVRQIHVQIPKILLSKPPLTNAIGFIESLNEKLKCEADLIHIANEKLLTVQGQLEALLPFLPDIRELANTCEEIKDLWSQIINVAYHAEHVIDSCSRVKDRQIWYGIVCLSYVNREMELIKLQVKKIEDRKIHSTGNVIEKLDLSSKVPVITDQVIVGFKKDADAIIERLIRGPARLSFVSIVGMPGLGKTTLARKVYNDSSIQYYFHKSAWCCVSQVYSRRKLLIDILGGITPNDVEIEELSEEELAERLWKSLRRQKYLIVIDDIWDIKAWHDLKISFPDDKNGSRILLTSRISNVALQVKPDCNPYHLCPLADDESWELFTIKVELRDDCPSELLGIGKVIVKSCKGLPLAIVVIAGVLGRMRENMLDWWKHIAENLSHQLAAEGCTDVLELSYRHLPDYLKPCFLYFGIFPQDKEIRVQKLMRLWIAEGFVRGTSKMSKENVAEKYLMDLVDRSLVLVTRRCSDGRVHSCSIHDLFHALCLARAKEDHLLQLIRDCDRYNVSCASLNPIKYDQYRLGIYIDLEPLIESRPTGPCARSLLFFSKCSRQMWHGSVASIFVNNFEYLKVLNFGDIFFGSFPDEIEALVFLRYLEVAGKFMKVPSSIEKLQLLETLILKSLVSVVLPDTIWLLRNLRHLDVKEDAVLTWSGEFQFSNIEILSCVRISGESYTKALFRRLPRLQKLSCIFQGALSDHFTFIGEPIIHFRMAYSELLGNLESLKVKHWGASGVYNKLQRFCFPETLRKLTLSRFCLPWNAISTIRWLPNLQVLKLGENAFTGPIWDMEDEPYSNLKFLALYHLDFEQWNVSADCFPCLEQLVLRHCYKLQELPPNIGDISTLKKTDMRWCNKTAAISARRILEYQQEMGNVDLEVIISHILN